MFVAVAAIAVYLLAISAWEKANKRFTLPLVHYGSKSQFTFHYGSVSYFFFSLSKRLFATAAGNLMI